MGVNTAISAERNRHSSVRTRGGLRVSMVVKPPMSKWVSPTPDIPMDRAATTVDAMPSLRLKSTFCSPAHISVL